MPASQTHIRSSESPPRVSVLIACPRGASGLARTIDSCLAQTVAATSLQIVTHDEDREAGIIADDYATRFSAVIGHHRTSRHIGADNLGRVLQPFATGDFSVLCLAGDEFRPHRIETALENLRTNPSFGGVFSRVERGDDDPLAGDTSRTCPHNTPYESERWRLLHGAQPYSGTATLRTSLFGELQLPPTLDAIGDIALWAQALSRCEFYFDAEPLVRCQTKPTATSPTVAQACQTAICVFQALQSWPMDSLFRLHSAPDSDSRRQELAQCHGRIAQHFLDLDTRIFGRAFLYTYEALRYANQACTLDGANALALSLLPEIRRRLGDTVGASQCLDAWRQTPPPTLELATDTTPPPDASVLAYLGWRQKRMLQEIDGEYFARRMTDQWRVRPRFTVFCPAISEEGRSACIDQMNAQVYPDWLLVIPGDATRSRQGDPRVLDIAPSEPLAASLAGTDRSHPDDWVLLLPAGATVEPHALFALADAIDRKPQWQLIYADDSDDTSTPRFKPDFDPVLLAGTGYLGAVAIAAPLLQALAATAPCSQDLGYALAWQTLGCLGETAIGHVDDILFGDVRSATAAPVALIEACARHHFRAGGRDLHCMAGPFPDTLWSIPALPDTWPSITMVRVHKPTDSNDGRRADIVHHGTYRGTVESLATGAAPDDLACVFERATGDYVLLLAGDVVADSPDWLEHLIGTMEGWQAAAAGPAIIDEQGRLEDAGFALGIAGVLGPKFPHLRYGEKGDELCRASLAHRVSALSSHCIAFRRAAIGACGGLDRGFATFEASIADLCLKLGRQKQTLIWTPQVILRRSANENGQLSEDPLPFVERWLPILAADPYWNRNLSLQNGTGLTEADLVARWQPERRDALRVLALPLRPSGQSEYRVTAPLRALERAGFAQVAVACEPFEGKERAPTAVELERLAPDTLYAQIAIDNVRLQGLLGAARLKPGLLRVFSLDDRISDIPAYNRAHRALAPEVVERNMRLALSACQRLVVSTQPLADQYAGQIDDIRIIPNRLERALWDPISKPQRRRGRKPRVGWAGASQHFGDLAMIAGVVEALADEVEWVFFGMIPPGCEAFVGEYIPPIRPFALYPARLATMALDVALAPLETNLFNEAKSNLRLLEYGFFGWPVIASDIFPYRTDNAPVTLVPNGEAAWIESIRQHIHDLDAAERRGDELQQWVRSAYLLEDHSDDWLSALTP